MDELWLRHFEILKMKWRLCILNKMLNELPCSLVCIRFIYVGGCDSENAQAGWLGIHARNENYTVSELRNFKS